MKRKALSFVSHIIKRLRYGISSIAHAFGWILAVMAFFGIFAWILAVIALFCIFALILVPELVVALVGMMKKVFSYVFPINNWWKLGFWIVSWSGLAILGFWLLDFKESLVEGIAAIWLVLVATTFMGFGNVTKKKEKSLLGFAIFVLAIFVFLYHYEGDPQIFVAWGTIIMALAAYMTIDESRRIRGEERSSHSKRRRLDAVLQWVTEVMAFNSRGLVIAITQADYSARADAENARALAETQAKARAIAANKSYIIREAEQLDSTLNGFAELKLKHPKQLKEIMENISGAIDSVGTSPESFGDFCGRGALWHEIENNCIEAMKIISDLGASLEV